MNPLRQKNERDGARERESVSPGNRNAYDQNADERRRTLRQRSSRSLWLGWRVEIPRGRRIPLGYGLAWVDISRCIAVCIPWPIHLIARWWRAANWRLHRIGWSLIEPGIDARFAADLQRVYQEEQALAEQYASGYLAGWEECFEACLEAVQEELGIPRSQRQPARQTAARATSRSRPRNLKSKPACCATDENVDEAPVIDRLKVN